MANKTQKYHHVVPDLPWHPKEKEKLDKKTERLIWWLESQPWWEKVYKIISERRK